MNPRYFIPFYGMYLMFKENPNGTNDLWGLGMPLYQGLCLIILPWVLLLLLS
jgi:hypothetical protein